VPFAVGDSEVNLALRLVCSSPQEIDCKEKEGSKNGNTKDSTYFSGFQIEYNGEQVTRQSGEHD
jgi:hypothetical protein